MFEKEMKAVELTSLPIQVIALCSPDGGMKPLKFRFEDESHQMHTVNILEVVDIRAVTYVGIEAFRYLCKAEQEGMRHLFELNYAVRAHRWALLRKIY